jgi:hypothetical protein
MSDEQLRSRNVIDELYLDAQTAPEPEAGYATQPVLSCIMKLMRSESRYELQTDYERSNRMGANTVRSRMV